MKKFETPQAVNAKCLLLGFILAIPFSVLPHVASATAVPASSSTKKPTGSLDVANCQDISGTVSVPGDPNAMIYVDLGWNPPYGDITVKAVNGKFNWSVDPTSELFDGHSHSVSAWATADGITQVQLLNSPHFVGVCSPALLPTVPFFYRMINRTPHSASFGYTITPSSSTSQSAQKIVATGGDIYGRLQIHQSTSYSGLAVIQPVGGPVVECSKEIDYIPAVSNVSSNIILSEDSSGTYSCRVDLWPN